MSKQQPGYKNEPLDPPPPYSVDDIACSGNSSSSSRPPARLPAAESHQSGSMYGVQQQQQQQQRPSKPSGPKIPWTYPEGYWCVKCHNTGYKMKNGKSCKKCWERFAHQPSVISTPGYVDPGIRIPFTNYRVHDDFTVSNGYGPQYVTTTQQPMVQQPIGPRYVRPGDPSIGGYLCGRCRGTGRVSVMLIDEELCPVCRGVGRVFS